MSKNHNFRKQCAYISFSLLSVVKTITLLKFITASDIVVIRRQSCAGKTGCPLQLASLFWQHKLECLHCNSIS